MGRRGRVGPGNVFAVETTRFLQYLHDSGCSDTIKRDDLKIIYNKDFADFRRNSVSDYMKVKWGEILLCMRRKKVIHELGDYFILGKDVQSLYENLAGSEEHRQTLEEWKEKAKVTPYFCEVCGVQCPNEKNFDVHKNGARHRIHKFHYEINRNRDQLIYCPDGIAIHSDPTVNDKCLIERQCGAREELYMSISVINNSKMNTLVFQRYLLLWDTGVFQLLQKQNQRPARFGVNISPGGSYEMLVKCKAPEDFGHHFVPIAFYFDWKDRRGQIIAADALTQEFVVRFVSLHVLGDLHEELAPTAPFKYPDQIPDTAVETIVPGEECPKSEKSLLQGKLKPCRLPPYLLPLVKFGLTGKGQIISNKLRQVLDTALRPENYQQKFDTLLWVEEIQMEEDIKRYDLLGVEMQLDRHTQLMVLEVPGLMERRPSVLKGDKVFIYANADRTVRYDAFVHKVELEYVYLGVGGRLKNSWLPGMTYDIRFDFLKFNLWLQHRAVSEFSYAKAILFPSTQNAVPARAKEVPLRPWFDKQLNPEQQVAVTNIVQGTSLPGPYLIFGPPGTGKTVTVTEAIRQVYHGQPDAKILVCCPENTAADIVMKKLISTSLPGTVLKGDIFRMYAVSRPFIAVPSEIKDSKQLNYDEQDKEFFYPAKVDLKEYKILIMTLSTSGRLVSADFPRNFYTHIFIDEGAHAIEPECCIPITGLLDANKEDCGQLVIAGDPRQLGPILRSPFAINYGLETSILERYMDKESQYSRSEESGYNANYVTKLVRNYRSHDAIISVPRRLFYDKELEACGDPMILTSMLNWTHLPNKKFPVIFHSVFGNDEREKSSPSFFNRDEISQVEKYLELLLKEKKSGQKVKPRDIGIISPYRKQVQKIREMVEKKFKIKGEIMVGSVEEFQGQECKIIIISTVRSNTNYVEKDLKYHLGFVKNPKRFNVALTRARALLIVIGNPMVLEQDFNWKTFLDYCDANGAFKGQHGKLKLGDNQGGLNPGDNQGDDSSGEGFGGIYNRIASLRIQSEDPQWEIRN